MHSLTQLIMSLPRRQNLSAHQQQAITMRILPYMTADFVIKSNTGNKLVSKKEIADWFAVRGELGVLTLLRDCIWRIQYRHNGNEESVLMHDIHHLGVLVFQSIMLQTPDAIDTVMKSLFQELSAAATWSISTSALKMNLETSSSLPTSFVTFIGTSFSLGAASTELPNLCREVMEDFSLSCWLWVSPISPSMILQFKGQSVFMHASYDLVQVSIGDVHIRHEELLEPNQWALITVTVKNRQLRLYIDDTLSGQQTGVSAFPPFPSDASLSLSGHVILVLSLYHFVIVCSG
jgi:hypothetical protein